jgi:hypothetical protein
MSLSDAEFVAAWGKAGGSPSIAARMLGMSERAVYARRERMEKRGISLATVPMTPSGTPLYQAPARNYDQRAKVDLRDGVAVVFSDAHWWPGLPLTTAHGALLRLVRSLKPNLVVANGDVFDGAAISRHDPDGWQNLPSVHAELETVKMHMATIASAARGARLMRTIGNHDLRFDRRLATQVPDYRHLAGMQLRDHLPEWAESWSIEINGAVMVKHRWHQGIHGAYNNALKGGRSIVTGHLHRLLASPWSDYNGRRWGIDTGTLSEPGSAQFDYAEDAAKNWGSGFVVLTFRDGQLGPPEFCEVIGGRAWFRGAVVHEANEADQLPHSRAGEAQAGAGSRQPGRVQRMRRGVDGDKHKQPAKVPVPALRKAGGAKGR